MVIEERGSTHVYKQLRMLSKEELERLESRCVHEQPAYCVAACPLKLDAKALALAVSQGNFDEARKLYEKIAPFPHILAAGCDAPCEAKCKLAELGDAVDIRTLERAALAYGQRGKARGVLRMKKRKTAAVFGSGLYSLFLAGELNKKAYPVAVFCREPDADALIAAEAGFAPPEALAADAALLRETDIVFHFGADPSREFIEAQRARFDVLCLSPALHEALYPEGTAEEALQYDRENRLVTGRPQGVTDAAFCAKKAALTVDRLVQNLDPGNSRGAEGAVETRLYTDTSGATALRRVPRQGEDYTREEAVREAGRCLQCRCDECVKACAYLRHYQKFPRILTREIYNNVSIIMGDHMMNKPINACALCGQCAVVCPNGYDMGEICHLARQNMVATDKMPLAPHEFALMDMLFSNSEAFLCRPQPGFETCQYVFFPGCQAAAIAPETVKAAYLDLCRRLEGGVGLLLGCCGTISDWAGRYELYGQTREFLDRELAKLGQPTVIAGCPSCQKELAGHEGLKVVGIWDVLLRLGLPEGAHGLERPAALHDACGARGDAGTQGAVRSLAKTLGVQLEDTPYSGDRSPCCGYGGLTAYANRELAGEMTEKCLERSDAPYISYCMACRDRFARAGRESRHILELVYGTDAGAPPDISQKRYNRLTLKKELLWELWQEETREMKLDFDLRFTEEALRLMDERMILKDDVIAVLEEQRRTGQAVYDGDSGLTVACKRVGNVTFWVKYTPLEDGGYLVHSAYSHRMQVVRRQG